MNEGTQRLAAENQQLHERLALLEEQMSRFLQSDIDEVRMLIAKQQEIQDIANKFSKD